MSDPNKRSPTLAAVIARAVDLRLASVRVALPAKIKTFDPASQLASVQPLLRETFEDETDAEQVESLPVISHVPVQFPGAGGFVITFPVAEGDPCWLVFSDRSLDKWIEQGTEVDPVDLRRHHLSDAVALLGVRSKAGALAEFDASNARIGKVGGVGISLRTGELHLGVTNSESATEPVLLGNTYATAIKTYVDALWTAMSGIVAPAVLAPVGAAASTARAAAETAYATAITLSKSTRVKVK
jgi:hypothetical protein